MRVAVVGTAGSGKSTFARRLSQVTGIEVVELDKLFWMPDWTERPTDEFRRCVDEQLALPPWIVPGNYFSRLGHTVTGAADVVVVFDLPLRTVMCRVAVRSVRRAATREEIWGGNRETLRRLVKFWNPQQSIIAFAWRQHRQQGRFFREIGDDPALSSAEVHRICNRDDERRVVSLISDRL